MNRSLALLAMTFALAAAAPPAAPAGELTVATQGLRNGKGVVHFCLTQVASRFLDCQKDPRSAHLTVAAVKASRVTFRDVAPGAYALVAFHDENANAKLDMTLRIPREGFAFSNNPTIRMRPPTYQEVRFALPTGGSSQTIRFKYIL
jgi:uncharacterized protein (DUF2141 family)